MSNLDEILGLVIGTLSQQGSYNNLYCGEIAETARDA